MALDDKAFVARFKELIDEDAKKYAKQYDEATGVYQALGLLAANMTYIDAQKLLGEGGVLGYYDPSSKELRIRAGKVTALARTVIVHELVHALDDQHFDLDRPEYSDATDEIEFGIAAMAEGNARFIENAYRDTMSRADRAAADAEELAFGDLSALSKLSLQLLQLEIAPYGLGEFLVGEILDDGGRAALDEAFVNPPRTSEQVMDPGKFLAKEAAKTVSAPKADGAQFDQGMFGALLLETILTAANDQRTSETAADGWSGDSYVAWRDGAKVCVRVNFAMDSSKDVTELRTALNRWIAKRPNAKVVTAADLTELTTCSA